MIENITTREQLIAFRDKYKMRNDWHEPDEQDIDAFPAVGNSFDNACCSPSNFYVRYARRQDDAGIHDTVYQIMPKYTHSEHGVFLFHKGEPVAFVNLAILLAIASGYEGYL